MSVQKIRGIVLKEIPMGESNKQIIILSKEHGKMLLSAKGARNPKSKFLAGTQLFSYCDFHVFEGKGFYSITQIDILENFYGLRNNILSLAYGAYFAEIVEKTVLESMECDEILELVLRAFLVLSKDTFDQKLCARIFELKFLQLFGFMPEMENCCICGTVGNCKDMYFSVKNGGIVCKECAGDNDFYISSGTVKAIRFVLDNEIKDIFKFNVSDAVLQELKIIINSYMKEHIGENFKTLEFAESL